MPGGRPTSERKGTLLAVRLAERHMHLLQQRAQREDVSVSEALRRLLDEHAPPLTRRGRPPTVKERQMLDRVFGAFGLVTNPRKLPRRRR